MKLNLNQYPQAIFNAAEAVNNLEADIARLRLRMTRIEAAADFTVAFDGSLKNDGHRKAERFSQLEKHPDYHHLQEKLIELTQEKSNALARLEQLRNEFSCLKLSTRMRISEQLAGVENREMVGL